MPLHSPAFPDGGVIPEKHTGVGADVSPPVSWSGLPAGARSIVLICEDPDAPSRAHPRPAGPWVHWILYDVPADVTRLPEGVPREAQPDDPAGARQGRNDFGDVGYRGPLPPKGSGPHRYFFRIYALDGRLDLAPEDATKASLLAAMKGHVLVEGQLMGTFERR